MVVKFGVFFLRKTVCAIIFLLFLNFSFQQTYRQTSDISRTLVGNRIVDLSVINKSIAH